MLGEMVLPSMNRCERSKSRGIKWEPVKSSSIDVYQYDMAIVSFFIFIVLVAFNNCFRIYPHILKGINF